MYVVYPDGTEKWNFSTDSRIEASPVIGSGGTVYVCSNDGVLYALGEEEDDSDEKGIPGFTFLLLTISMMLSLFIYKLRDIDKPSNEIESEPYE